MGGVLKYQSNQYNLSNSNPNFGDVTGVKNVVGTKPVNTGCKNVFGDDTGCKKPVNTSTNTTVGGGGGVNTSTNTTVGVNTSTNDSNSLVGGGGGE